MGMSMGEVFSKMPPTRRHPGRYCEPGSIAPVGALEWPRSDESRVQILPVGVHAFDQFDLPASTPMLDTLFF